MSDARAIVPAGTSDGAIDQAAEMEFAVLGTLLLHPDAWTAVPFLKPEHFQQPICKAGIGGFIALREAGERPDVLTIARHLKAAGTVTRDLARCLSSHHTLLVNLPEYGLAVYQDWHYRELARLAERARLERDPSLLNRHRLAIDAVIEQVRGQTETRLGVRAAMDALLQRISDVSAGRVDDGVVSTGYRGLDELMGGYRSGELVVAAGRPGSGKTVYGTSSGRHVAHAGRGVLIMSLEVETRQVAARLAADEIADDYRRRRVPYGRIMKGRLAADELETVGAAAHAVRALPIEIDARGGLGVADIAATARTIAGGFKAAGTPLGLVVIDYLGLMRHEADSRRGLNHAQEIGQTTGALKALAKELEVTVLLLVQLNRDVEKRDQKRPTLADLRDSGAIEQDADVVMFLYRAEYYALLRGEAVDPSIRNILEVVVAKNRPGKTGTVTLACDVASNAIRDMGRLG